MAGLRCFGILTKMLVCPRKKSYEYVVCIFTQKKCVCDMVLFFAQAGEFRISHSWFSGDLWKPMATGNMVFLFLPRRGSVYSWAKQVPISRSGICLKERHGGK